MDGKIGLSISFIWSQLIIYGTFSHNQKVDLDRISVLRDVTKIWKKSPVSKMSRTFILHTNNNNNNNNNAEKLKIIVKNNFLINNQVTYPFFITNKFIDFSESIWIKFFFFKFKKMPVLKKIETIIVQLLVQSHQKFFGMVWNLVTKILEIRNVTFTFYLWLIIGD